MNGQARFCKRCGTPLHTGLNYCTNCGEALDEQPRPTASAPYYAQNQNGYYAASMQGYPPQPQPQPQPPVRRKTYTAQKFVAMGFGIGDLVMALSFLVCGMIFYAEYEYVKSLYYQYLYNDNYYLYSSYGTISETLQLYEALANTMFFFTGLLVLGAVIAWIMFFVYSAKRSRVMREIQMEKQHAQQAPYWR